MAVTKHVEQFPDIINCVTLHLVGYIYWNRCTSVMAVTKHVEQFPDIINCVTLHLVGHIYWNRCTSVMAVTKPVAKRLSLKDLQLGLCIFFLENVDISKADNHIIFFFACYII